MLNYLKINLQNLLARDVIRLRKDNGTRSNKTLFSLLYVNLTNPLLKQNCSTFHKIQTHGVHLRI